MTKEEQKAYDDLQAQLAETVAENEKLERAVKAKGKDERQRFQAKDVHVDYSIEVEATDKDKFHNPGERYHVGEANARLLEKKGRVKVIGKYLTKALILLMVFAGFASQGQIISSEKSNSGSYLLNMDNTLGSNITRDTVTDAGTGVLITDRAIIGDGTVTIVALVTKVSGTVAGTLVLTGSIDGTNYQTINQPNIQTAVVTVAAVSDATARYSFSLSTNPFRYYKVTHTGTGTMVSYLDAAILKH